MENDNNIEKLDLFNLLSRFFKALKSMWIVVLVLSLAMGSLMLIRARRNYVPYYEASAVFSVTSGYGVGDVFTSSQHYDSAAAQNLAESFPYLLNTDIMRDLITAKLEKAYINGTISAESIAETNLFQMTVRSKNAQDAYDILCAVIESYLEVAVYMVDNPLIIIRDEPRVPTAPVNSFSGGHSFVKGLLLGLFLGFGITLLRAILAKTINSAEDLRKLVNIPLLASVPHVVLKRSRVTTRSFISPEDDRRLDESFRSLRTRVRKLLSDCNGKILLMTSTVPGEGKSTLCANLALSLAAEGHRVALLDADLRNQTVYRMFGAGKAPRSLMELLRNPELNVDDFLTPVDGTNLCYLSGNSTRKRHYSIDAKASRRIMDELSARFDYVIVDSPPCGVVSDTALLCRYVDCVVYVVRQDHAAENQILDAVEGLHQREISLAGCVLNDVPKAQVRSSFNYGYGKEKFRQ